MKNYTNYTKFTCIYTGRNACYNTPFLCPVLVGNHGNGTKPPLSLLTVPNMNTIGQQYLNYYKNFKIRWITSIITIFWHSPKMYLACSQPPLHLFTVPNLKEICEGIYAQWSKDVKIKTKNIDNTGPYFGRRHNLFFTGIKSPLYQLTYQIWKESVKASMHYDKKDLKIRWKPSIIGRFWHRANICFTCIKPPWYLTVLGLKKIGLGTLVRRRHACIHEWLCYWC